MTLPQQNETAERKTRWARIEWTMLRDVDDNYSPPEKPMLRLAVIDDVVSLVIGTVKEDNKSQTFTQDAQIVVDVECLCAALTAAVSSRREKVA